jgi:vacuolar-type H+-ATPase subunit I/STV1
MTDHENSKSLREAMDAAARAMNLTNEAVTAPLPSPPARSEAEKVFDIGRRVLRSQQARLVEVEAAFERRRVELVCHYRGEISRLEQEVEDELAQLSRSRTRDLDAIRATIDQLKALRDG